MAASPNEEPLRSRPARLVFVGKFQMWAQSRLPCDQLSSDASASPIMPSHSGGEFAVPNGSIVGAHAASTARSEVRDEYLRSGLVLPKFDQRAIPLPLMRSLLVAMHQVAAQGPFESASADEPAAVDAFALHRACPVLNGGVQIGAAQPDGDARDVAARGSVASGSGELGISAVDQVPCTDLGQPVGVDHHELARSLNHERSDSALGNADDMAPAGLQMNGEEHIVAGLSKQSPGKAVRYKDTRSTSQLRLNKTLSPSTIRLPSGTQPMFRAEVFVRRILVVSGLLTLAAWGIAAESAPLAADATPRASLVAATVIVATADRLAADQRYDEAIRSLDAWLKDHPGDQLASQHLQSIKVAQQGDDRRAVLQKQSENKGPMRPAAAAEAAIRLWPAQRDEVIAETVDARELVRGVTVPRLMPFLAERGNGTAVVICPGGGYMLLDVMPHVVRVAQRLVPLGISVFGLYYRTAPPSTRVPGDALDDLRRAIRVIRERATELRVDPVKLVGLGFSAGANLLLTNASEADPQCDADDLHRGPAELRHLALLCLWPHGRIAASYAIRPNAPAVLLCATLEDTVAPVEFSRDIAGALQRAGGTAEVVEYPHGGHSAFNIMAQGPAVDWTGDFLTWLGRQGLYSARAGD